MKMRRFISLFAVIALLVSLCHAVLADGDTDTKGAITGSIAEAYYEIPDEIIDKALSYLPKDMSQVLSQFYQARPRSFQPLIDTCFAGDDFSDVSWGMLYDIDGKEVYDEIKNQVKNDHEQMRKMMAERTKARENW
jgi:hypothetical protein